MMAMWLDGMREGLHLKAVLYSDQVVAENDRVDRHLLRLMPARPRIGYLPSAPDPDRRYFREKVAYYGRYGITDLVYVPLDRPLPRETLDDLLACDAIHLSGGSTRAFLARLRQTEMIEPLRRYAAAGGILVGTSAGAILMTPDIAVDALFQGRPPERSADGAGLSLVPFEFFPHLGADPAHLPALVAYSRQNAGPILACRDGDGVIVDAGRTICVGDIVLVEDGTVELVDAQRFGLGR
jgi:dipeptidase E